MPRPGIHPIMHRVTVVLRNGASIEVMSAVPRAAPYFLRQDPTNTPLWTGKDSSLASEDEHMAKFLKKYEGIAAAGLNSSTEGQTQ